MSAAIQIAVILLLSVGSSIAQSGSGFGFPSVSAPYPVPVVSEEATRELNMEGQLVAALQERVSTVEKAIVKLDADDDSLKRTSLMFEITAGAAKWLVILICTAIAGAWANAYFQNLYQRRPRPKFPDDMGEIS
jgi:hypothetical protein